MYSIKNISVVLYLLCFAGMNSITGQQFITFPNGSAPLIDGVMSLLEWSDAAHIEIKVNANETVKVFYKTHADTLYFSFVGRLESGNFRFPEICLDTRNDKSFFWEGDDWWFHVSATDCDYNGAPAVYTDCALDQDDWLAMPNIVHGLPIVDSIEIAIPFSKVNLASKDTFGIAFNVTNTFSTWNFWPEEAQLQQPATWATACFSQTTSSGIPFFSEDTGIQIYPNPCDGQFTISSALGFSDVILYDGLGKLITAVHHQDKVNQISLEVNSLNLQKGTYMISVDRVMRPVCILD
jgi:hypothetical protein